MKVLKAFSIALVGVGLLAVPSLAQAQELTLRAEPGVAIPLTDPQAQRFGVGGAIAVKPELTLFHAIGVGPSLQWIGLPSNVSGVDTGTATRLGAFVRVKRPHDETNTGRGLSAASPWVDADLGYVRTDGLDRLGTSVAAGVQVPTSDSRWLWVGPFARYDLVNQEDGKRLVNTNSAKTLILGLSFELGAPAPAKKVEEPKPVPPPVVPQEQPKPVPPPPVTVTTVTTTAELKTVVQFAWDSPVLDATANSQLSDVVSKLTSAKDFSSIRIEGHASSEGQVKHNDVLSQNRANSVLEFLAAHGVPREKLSAVGFGSRVPVADNKTEAGRVLNRRSEFTVKFVIVRQVSQQN